MWADAYGQGTVPVITDAAADHRGVAKHMPAQLA